MTRTLQKVGNSKGLLLSRDMLDHLDVTDAVEVSFEKGKIVLTKPSSHYPVKPGRRRKSFEAALESTIEQYGPALQKMADADRVSMEE